MTEWLGRLCLCKLKCNVWVRVCSSGAFGLPTSDLFVDRQTCIQYINMKMYHVDMQHQHHRVESSRILTKPIVTKSKT